MASRKSQNVRHEASSTLHLVRFGLLTACAIVLAFLCEMVLTPALLATAGAPRRRGAANETDAA